MRLRPFRLLPVLVLCWGAAASGADDTTILHPGGPGATVAPAVASTRQPGATAVSIALILFGAGGWALWQAKKKPRASREAGLGIRETRALGGRQYLVVAAYENQKFLIGVSPGNINLISQLGPDDSKGAGP